MSSYQVIDRGIFRCLPIYQDDPQGLTAIVTGSNGISGHYLSRVLQESPHRWSKIYCLSRNAPAGVSASNMNCEHVAVDFLRPPSEIAAILTEKGVSADFVFFMSYIQPPHRSPEALWSEAEELCRVNSALLSNFTTALDLSGVTPRRFILQTGAKNYGGHIGPNKVPQEESAPRHRGQVNFYFDQEDILFDYCAKNKTNWAICMPAPIIGAVQNASMTLALPLAVYACVCAELGEIMEFPSDITAWQTTQCMTSGKLNAYMIEWIALKDHTANEKFNSCDTSVFTWEKAWPIIASWFGATWQGPRNTDQWLKTQSLTNHREYGGKNTTRASFRLGDFMNSDRSRHAWKSLEHRFGLRPLTDQDGMFAFLDGMIRRAHPVAFSMDKSREFGWNGYVNTMKSLHEVFKELHELRLIPPFQSDVSS